MTEQAEVTERQVAEAQAVLAAILEHSNDAIIGKTIDGVIISWNRAAHRMFGYTAAEALGRGVVMLVPADRIHEESDILRRIGAGEAVEHFESERVAKGGRVVQVSLTISPIRDRAGRVIGASKIARDITAQHAARQRLRASHALLRALVDGITDPVYVKDRDGRYLLSNAAVGDVAGRPAAGVIGATDDQVLGGDAASAARACDRRIMDDDAPRTFEESLTVGGVARHFLTTKAPYHDAQGRVAGVLGISRDVTLLKAAERAVRASERHLRGVLDGLLFYVAVVGPGDRLSGMNLALRQALESRGVSTEIGAGRPVADLLPPGVTAEARAALGAAAAAVTATGEVVRLDALQLLGGPAGVVLDVMFSPMRDGDGRAAQLIVSAVDVTERERAAGQARERQAALAHMERVRTMGQMAAGLAHELNQPFGAIVNYAAACRRLLASGRLLDEQLGQALADIGAEATRGGAIVQRLRGFVKKRLPPQASAVAINGVVDDALRLLAHDLLRAGVQVRTVLADGLPTVLADAILIGQVLINLIHNALDAMAGLDVERRRLVIQTESVGHWVRVTVCDRGRGASAEAMAHMFDAFFTTKTDGLGVGLALCRTILEEHGGHLTAEPNDGGGMTFAFTLRPTTLASG